ncbi:MAG: hypothetical protein ACXV74_11380 [Methylobacter sp.]
MQEGAEYLQRSAGQGAEVSGDGQITPYMADKNDGMLISFQILPVLFKKQRSDLPV